MKNIILLAVLPVISTLHAEAPSSHWPMENIEDATLHDVAGARNATVPELIGKPDAKSGETLPDFQPETAPGIKGDAILLQRQQQGFLAIPAVPKFDFSNGLTISAWIKMSSRKQGVIVSCAEDMPVPDGGWTLSVGYGRVRFLAVNAVGEVVRVSSGEENLPQDTWTHVAAVVEATSIRLYINGEEVASTAFEGPVMTSAKKIPMVIGNHATIHAFRHSECPAFGGLLDEVKIWETPLDAAGVKAESEDGLQ